MVKKTKIYKILAILIVFLTASFAIDDMLVALRLRASEDKMYELITKINTINYCINDHILNYATIPTKLDLEMNYPSNIDNVWWPKNFDGDTTQLSFTIDPITYSITYSNIFLVNPPADFQSMFERHILLKPDSTYDASTVTLNIPFDIETIKFQEKINAINLKILAGEKIIIGSNQPCNTINDLSTWYKPNGSGEFELYNCRVSAGSVWQTVANFDGNIVQDSPQNANLTGQIQFDKDETNTSQAFMNISTNVGNSFSKVVR